MSLIRDDLANYIRLKQQQLDLEARLQQIKSKVSQYEPTLTNYLVAENKPLQINNTYKISIQQTYPHEPLTFKYLEKCFQEVIPNQTQRTRLLSYIKDNRTRVYKQKLSFDILTPNALKNKKG